MCARCTHPIHTAAGVSFLLCWLLPLKVGGVMRDVRYACFLAFERAILGSPPNVRTEKYYRRAAPMYRHSINERLPGVGTAPLDHPSSIANKIYHQCNKEDLSDDGRKALKQIGK